MSDRLATARWEDPRDVATKYPYTTANLWLGRTADFVPIGYADDRHICVVSGTRGGKGTSILINNLCYWPGSAVVIDPKGENATVTAARRGAGDRYCEGLGQVVHVLDPFNVAHVEQACRSCFNPLDALDPARDETIDEAARLANAIIVLKDERPDPFFDEAARAMLRGVILHVLTSEDFVADERTLLTVHELLKRGDWQTHEAMEEDGQTDIDPPHLLLWRSLQMNRAFSGVVAGDGTRFLGMMGNSAKTFESVLQTVLVNLEFIDSPGMRRVLARSDFQLSELKTRPAGMTLYLSLPQRYMDTHYRWLRMMVALITAQMEITGGQPATGHPVLMLLDEFAGLKRMTAIENAVAQIAGFGVKLMFVLQSLEQLKAVYKDGWETFLSNAGLKIFFSIDDNFTREYVSKQMGDTELVRLMRSENKGGSRNYSEATGTSQTTGTSSTRGGSTSIARGTSRSTARGTNQSDTFGDSETFSLGWNVGRTISRALGTNWSKSHASSTGESTGTNWSSTSGSSYSFGQGGGSSFNRSSSSGGSQATNWSETDTTSKGGSETDSWGYSSGESGTHSKGRTTSRTDGRSLTETEGTSATVTHGTSWTEGTSSSTSTSQTTTRGTGSSWGEGASETIHRRPLVRPEEIGKLFARLDDRSDPLYPGLALVLVTGGNPLMVQRRHYFEDVQFIDCFSPHPDHAFIPPAAALIEGLGSWVREMNEFLDRAPGDPYVRRGIWRIGAREIVGQEQTVFEVVLPHNGGTLPVLSPCSGKAILPPLPAPAERLDLSETEPLLTVKYYEDGQPGTIDPLRELRAYLENLRQKRRKPPLPSATIEQDWTKRLFYIGLAAILVTGLIILLIWFGHDVLHLGTGHRPYRQHY